MTDTPPPVPFDVLLRHRDFLRALALRLVADPNAADDVEQETWLEAMRRPPRDTTSARGWLATVARNAARKLGRSASRRAKYESAATPREPHASTDELAAEAETGRGLIGFVLALPEPYRGTVLLRYFEGLETTEIAARTGVPVETVRTRLKRATAQLRDAMDRRHGGDRAAWALVLAGPAWKGIGLAGAGKGIAMGAAKKLTIAAVVVLAIGGVAWRTWPSGVAPIALAPETPATTTAVVPAPQRAKPVAAADAEQPADPLLRVDPKSPHRVTVRTADGAVVAGAAIDLYLRRELNPKIPPEMRARFGEIPAPDARYVTGADGVALLPRLRFPVSGTMIVRRKGFALAQTQANESEIVLRPGQELTGRVVDARGRAVGGAPVAAGDAHSSGWSGPTASITTATADADGRFTLQDLPSGTSVLFAAWPGGSPTRVLEVVLPSAREVTVTLPGGGAIQGKVTESGTGVPIEGAVVAVGQFGNSSPIGPAFAAATTRADGTYRIDRFAADTWDEVKVSKKGWFEPPHGPRGIANRLALDATATLDLQLVRGGRVTGRVVGPDGPVAAASISAIGANDGTRTKSDADGNYAVELPAGRAAFAVQAAGCVQEGWSGRWMDDFRAGAIPAGAAVDVVGGEEVKHDLVLVRGVTISGRVLGADGSPVASARVEVRYDDANESDGPRGWDGAPAATTDADGRFVVTGVVPESKLNLVSESEAASGAASVSVARDDVRDVVVRLVPWPAPRPLHVRVVWPEGAAPRDALWFTGDWDGWVANSGNRDNAFLRSSAHVVPPDGRFDVPVPAWQGGAFLVRVVATGFAPADTPPQRLAKDVTEASVEIRPIPADQVRLAGRVVVKGGTEPVEGALIRLRMIDPAGPPIRKDEWHANDPRPVIGPVAASTAADGSFDVPGLAPGKYDVQVTAAGFEWWRGTTEVPADSLRVEVPRLGALTGRVHFADGRPAAGVQIYLDRADTYRCSVHTDADGRFRADDVPTGGIGVHVWNAYDGTGANIRQYTSKAWAHAGEDLDLAVEPALAIAGCLVDAAGAPVLCMGIVRVTPTETKSGDGSAATRADGTFEVRGLAPGRCRVSVDLYPLPGKPRMRCDAIDGVEAGTSGLTLVARSGLSIEGVVTIPPEGARSALRVLARKAELRAKDYVRAPDKSGTLDSHGHFLIDGLDAGRWRIVFENDQGLDSPWQAGDAAVVEAGAGELHLTLTTASSISGRVSYADEGVLNCRVVAIAAGDEKDACSTTASYGGAFTFVGLDPSKRWNIQAWQQDLAPSRAENVPVGATGVELVLTRGLDLKGRLFSADGTPAPRTTLRLESANGGINSWASCNDKGEIDAHAIPPGEFVVKVYVPAAKDGDPGEYVEIGRVRAGDSGVELRLPK